jgi:hypothetical protein
VLSKLEASSGPILLDIKLRSSVVFHALIRGCILFSLAMRRFDIMVKGSVIVLRSNIVVSGIVTHHGRTVAL